MDDLSAVISELSEKKVEQPCGAVLNEARIAEIFLGHVDRAIHGENLIGSREDLDLLVVNMIVVVSWAID